MNHYSVIALENFFKKNNLFLFDIEQIKIQKGSIIGYVCHKDFIKKTQRLRNIIKIERKNNIDKIKTVKKLQNVIKNNKNKILKIINKSYKKINLWLWRS